DLVSVAVEDEEGGLVLVAVAAIAAARVDGDEVGLDALRQEGVVAGPHHPLGAGLRRRVLVTDRPLVPPRPSLLGYHVGRCQALLAVSLEVVPLALEASDEDAASHLDAS